MSSAQSLTSEEAHAQFLQSSRATPNQLHVVQFHAQWHEPSKAMIDVLNVLTQSQQPPIKSAIVDAESLESVASLPLYQRLQSVPTFFFLKNGTVLDVLEGADAAELTAKTNRNSRVPVTVTTTTTATTATTDGASGGLSDEMKSRLHALVNASPIVAFIKGTPQQPRCGFTKQLLAIFADRNIQYSTFDILSDQSVRDSLKVYSQWPTYPQVYQKGELVGGLDVIKELIEAGEFPTEDTTGASGASATVKEGWLDASKTVNDRVKSLLHSAPVLLCMKGSRSQPQCGFSRQAVELLEQVVPGLKYETFDVFSSPELREGIKTYSSWPTYPQLYVNGELIGGLDVLKELQEAGELTAELAKASQ